MKNVVGQTVDPKGGNKYTKISDRFAHGDISSAMNGQVNVRVLMESFSVLLRQDRL